MQILAKVITDTYPEFCCFQFPIFVAMFLADTYSTWEVRIKILPPAILQGMSLNQPKYLWFSK